MTAFEKPKRRVTRAFIHCSASDFDHHDDIAVIKRWHMQERGFSDVGYHFFITRAGLIQYGRSLERIPAAQAGNNAGTIAICVHGNSIFKPEQMMALRRLCQEIHAAYNANITFHGHKEVDRGKACPVFDYKQTLGLDDKGRMPPAI